MHTTYKTILINLLYKDTHYQHNKISVLIMYFSENIPGKYLLRKLVVQGLCLKKKERKKKNLLRNFMKEK